MSSATKVRSEIFQSLLRELIGPDPRPEHAHLNDGEEILRPQDPPRLRYSAGVLFPSAVRIDLQDEASEQEIEGADDGPPDGTESETSAPGGGSDDADSQTEQEVCRANEFLPSAMGLTALVRLPKSLRVSVSAGRYEKRAEPGLGKQDKKMNWQPHHWRKRVEPQPIEIDCGAFKPTKVVTCEFQLDTGTADLKLSLHVYSRPYAHAPNPSLDRMITFTLINRTPLSGERPKDSECFFQCRFAAEGADGTSCFLEYPEPEGLHENDEEASLRMLYRHRRTFAVGHGCAASWSDTEGDQVNRIDTETLPSFEIKPIVPREIPGIDLSMATLAKEDDAEAYRLCEGLAEAYGSWIDEQQKSVESPDFLEEFRASAKIHIARCRECHERVREGIRLLRSDRQTALAFAWMNKAMLDQQLHYKLTTDYRREWVVEAGQPRLNESLASVLARQTADPATSGLGRWRPFQLAFILMNLAAIADRQSPARSVVDLIWFPTGGGKTEAYLGLTAFTIFRRRLRDAKDSGTTVLMRYTLRLLTTQQFQRAASLICACELIRRSHPEQLGSVRISIGLWVGKSVTPNQNADAVKSLNALQRNGKPNDFVLLTCPWCAAEMGPVPVGNSYRVKGYRKDRASVVFRCEDPDCAFESADGLPLLVVDDAIYAERSTLVIGTVDKFALLPWIPDAQPRRLFGLDDRDPVSPPDLIIQDELHLISGALGSMVGMYESTIDALCHHLIDGQSLPPKVVASTATICRAHDQVGALYARDLCLFPPQGLRAGDSFYAEERTHSADGTPLPGRLYVGAFGSALSSHVTAQVRVVSALLQAVKSVPSARAEDLDPYWTLMAYFNSLRELGHAATLVRADIREHLNAVWDRLNIRKPAPDSGNPDLRRFINRDMELTSRIRSGEITDVLQQLFNPFPGTNDRRPVDICLATNMIQVGLDVPRLGLMVVVGQPKMTAEYIQATSRVGRDARGPGLVVTVLNPGKPRDRSHYEHFRSYHQSIYRWVEPTSVTPFAVPVRERALHAQLVTLARYWGNTSLRGRPTPAPDDLLVSRLCKTLLDRICKVDPAESAGAAEMLDQFLSHWRRITPPLYGQFGPPPQETPLMYPSGTEPRAIWAGRAKATPSSMRNVDAGCDAAVISQFLEP